MAVCDPEEGSHRAPPGWHPDPGLPASVTVGNKPAVYTPQSMLRCSRSLHGESLSVFVLPLRRNVLCNLRFRSEVISLRILPTEQSIEFMSVNDFQDFFFP